MSLPVGTVLQGGKYKIVRYISSGGFGCTYEAIHTIMNEPVAIKEFFVKDFCNRSESTNSVVVGTQSKISLVEKLKIKFLAEARSLFRMNHPNIVRVTDVFEENDTAYYVMDYINGPSLNVLINQRGVIPEAEALVYIRQIASALKYVHSLKCLHLDIKPGNIMIDGNKAVLIDFGVSKQYDEVANENTSTLLGSSPGYAPIEQTGNNVVKFSAAADIYALGATLYKALTGITPLPANIIASGEALQPIPKHISESTRKAVAEAMRLNKANRPQSIDEFMQILDGGNVANGMNRNIPAGVVPQEDTVGPEVARQYMRPSPPPPPPSAQVAPRNPKPKKSNGKIVGIVIMLLLLVGVGVGATIYFTGQDTKEHKERRERKKKKREEPVLVGHLNGYEWVDLGLPSGLKWATCNVGAYSPEEYGSHFAWGEVTSKGYFSEPNYEHHDGDSHIYIGTDIGDTYRDAAKHNWGSGWRLPTQAECEELINHCTWTQSNYNGVDGCEAQGPNGKCVFFPYAGNYYMDNENEIGTAGDFWTSTYDEDENCNAMLMYLTNEGNYTMVPHWREFGRSVRAVCE